MPSPLLSTFFYPTSYISSTFFHQNSISQNASSQKSAIYRPTFVQGSFKVRPSYLYNSKFFFLKILIPISLKNYLCGSLFRVSPRAPNQTLLHFLISKFVHFPLPMACGLWPKASHLIPKFAHLLITSYLCPHKTNYYEIYLYSHCPTNSY